MDIVVEVLAMEDCSFQAFRFIKVKTTEIRLK